MKKLVATIDSYTHKNETKPFFTKLEIELKENEIVCLLGGSGAGKTRLLRILLGHTDGTFEGNVAYHINGTILNPIEACALGIVGLFSEDAGLLPWLTVNDNLTVPFSLNPQLQLPTEEIIHLLLEKANLDKSVLSKKPRQLSFGMLQRIRLVRTLAYSPKFILLDETFTGLDPVTAFDIADMVVDFVTSQKSCCLLITHDLFNASRIASKIIFLKNDRKFYHHFPPFDEKSVLDIMKSKQKGKL